MKVRITSSFSLGRGRFANVGDVLATPDGITEPVARVAIARRWAAVLPEEAPGIPAIQTREPGFSERDPAFQDTAPASRRRKVRNDS